MMDKLESIHYAIENAFRESSENVKIGTIRFTEIRRRLDDYYEDLIKQSQLDLLGRLEEQMGQFTLNGTNLRFDAVSLSAITRERERIEKG